MATWVLKFSQVDKPDQPILVHVSSTCDEGSLNLNLLATDGDAAYRTKVREKSLNKLQADNYDGSDQSWKQLLHYVLISRKNADVAKSVSDSLESDCVISGKGSKKTLSITLRTKVEDITHKLGSIELNHSDETNDVDLFGWACQAIDQRDSFATQLQIDAAKSGSAEAYIKALEQQLEELVKAKEEHENELLSKFALLLNEKKLHIRTQQQQIANQDAPPVVPHPSSRKRKHPKNGENDHQSEESEAFETMDVDQVKSEEDDDAAEADRQSTPSRASSISSDDKDLDQIAKTTPKRSTKAAVRRESNSTPPPRSLPFATKGSKDSTKQGRTTSVDQPKTRQKKKQENQAKRINDKEELDDDESTADEDDDDEL